MAAYACIGAHVTAAAAAFGMPGGSRSTLLLWRDKEAACVAAGPASKH